MKKKLLSVLLCTAMVAAMLAGCGGKKGSDEGSSDSAESKDADSKLKIGIAMKTQDGPYFVTLTKAVQEKCAEIGLVEKASDVVVLNADMDVAKQSENFETFISQKYDLIFVDCIDPDNVIADEKAAYDAGIPVINIDSGVNDGSYSVTTVYSNNEQNGRMCGLSFAESMGDEEIYSIMLSGEKGNVAGTERRQGLICGILEQRLGITEEEAWKLTKEADDELLSKGSYTNEEAKFTIAGQGWGNWTVNDILNDANDLVVKTKDKLNTMFGENDQMLFGGMQAADDAGLTGIHYVAAADGAKEAYDYINGTTTSKSGEYYCTGENSPVQVAITATNIAKEILVDGADPDSYDEVTMTEAIAVTKDNVDERYEFGF
ncbi:substrate-binding domain-containing protein [Faecalicatena contorta]|uniref:Monosaccharide ABC transporter substrate-binding protein, CUT2 family n=1 Tax=Faecalicatena contorta TaxID=39482 RepID=A0A315ZVZ3_9FIRM|nr:substrate-binding domain-containing protein [Faecalicatena contorta]PWJ48784.1 monosaccharide ABC transporter substrate-binding protein (CUT2 family) [Faecalicatena contorta]SUQ15207.1 monosaccharide ABC transporter substrate-binding protein, CUT2 family [Faecalicatena contorta]